MSIAKKIAKPDHAEASYDADTATWTRGRHAGKQLRMPLAAVRGAAAKTQVQVAEASGITQSEVSKIERRDIADTQVSTLRRYVEALGGELEVVVVLNGRRLTLQG